MNKRKKYLLDLDGDEYLDESQAVILAHGIHEFVDLCSVQREFPPYPYQVTEGPYEDMA